MIEDNSQAQQNLASQRDRITKLLTQQTQPVSFGQDVGDIAQSFLSALSQNNGAAGFQQAYQNIGQARQQKAAGQLQNQNSLYQLMKDQVAQGNEDAAHVDKTIKDVVGEDPKAYEAVANELHSMPQEVNKSNATMAVTKAANKLGIKSFSKTKEDLAVQEAKSKINLQGAQANYYNNRDTGIGANGSKAPSGYRYTPTGDLEPIPNGPADYKRQQAQAADATQLDMVNNSLDTLQGAISDVKNAPGLSRILGTMGKIPNIPGTDAADAQAFLDTLNAKAFIGAINTMRAASKTGGAVGNVSNKEGDKLQSSYVALKTSQSLPQFKENLEKFYKQVEDTKGILKNSYNRKYNMSQPENSEGGGRLKFNPETGEVE